MCLLVCLLGPLPAGILPGNRKKNQRSAREASTLFRPADSCRCCCCIQKEENNGHLSRHYLLARRPLPGGLRRAAVIKARPLLEP